MDEKRIDIETYMIAGIFRDRLFRVRPRELAHESLSMGELNEEDIQDIMDGLLCIGFSTPILLDSDNSIIVGRELVEAAKRLDVTDIPTLRIEELNAGELAIYVEMTQHFFDLANIDSEICQLEVQNVLSFAAIESAGGLTNTVSA